jgi:hypothetical protein
MLRDPLQFCESMEYVAISGNQLAAASFELRQRSKSVDL